MVVSCKEIRITLDLRWKSEGSYGIRLREVYGYVLKCCCIQCRNALYVFGITGERRSYFVKVGLTSYEKLPIILNYSVLMNCKVKSFLSSKNHLISLKQNAVFN